MANWKNLDTLKAYDELLELWNEVEVKEVMAGESGAKRVAEYNVPIAAGLTFNYAARPVDDKVLKTMQDLADEAELAEKYKELYNGAVINTGENRLVLHQLCRGQLGDDVIADGVNKRDFYAKQQARIAEFVKRDRQRSRREVHDGLPDRHRRFRPRSPRHLHRPRELGQSQRLPQDGREVHLQRRPG